MTPFYNALLTLGVLTFLLFLRVLWALPKFHKRPVISRKRGTPTHLQIVLGSGGHTAEMLLLLRDLDTSSYTYRRYIVSSGDSFSAQKAADFEKQLAAEAKRVRKHYGAFDIKTVTRARNIHQSLLTTPLSAMICIWDCLNILRTPPATTATHQYPYPNLIMANGPATATVMIFAALVLRVFGLAGTNKSMRCIYVESWARVKTASLSGKILSITGVCDRLLVQWAALSESGFEFRGQLVA